MTGNETNEYGREERTTNRLRGIDRERLVWGVIGVALVALVAYVLYSFVGVFVFGLFVYYATRPIYRRIEPRIGRPGLTAVLSLFVIALPVLALVGYAIDVGIEQLGTALGTNLGRYQALLRPFVGNTVAGTSDSNGLLGSLAAAPGRLFAAGGTDTLRGAAGPVLDAVGVASHDLLLLIVTLTLAFFLLRDDVRLAAWVRSSGIREESATAAFFAGVDTDLETVYFGNVITAVVIGVLAAVTYNVLGLFAPAGVSVPAPTLLGLLTGVASLIPVVGMKLVYGPIVAVLAGEALLSNPSALWYPVVFLVVSVAVFDSVFEFVLRPYITGRGLHTGLVLLSYLFGTILFGWYGLFFGPLLLVLLVHFARTILPGLLRGGALTPAAVGEDPVKPDEEPALSPPDGSDSEESSSQPSR